MRSRTAVATVLAVLLALVAAAPASAADSCTGDPDAVQRLDLTVGGEPAYGFFVLPAGKPTGLVVFAHGFSFNVDAWRTHMTKAARRDGVVAVTMNYRGLQDLPKDASGFERSRGYPVRKGAQDLVAAAQHFEQRCGGFPEVGLLGISMGGNVSGIALAGKPKSADGSPLFDAWVGVEGIYNVTETYQGARALGPANAFAAAASADIEAETGGTPETQPAAYAERTVVARAADVAASGVRHATLVHAVEDGLALYNQATELSRTLRQNGLRTDLYTVGRKGEGDEDTTIASYTGARTENAGHGPEWSQNHVVIQTGFDRLSALMTRGEPVPCDREFMVDGAARTTSPDPKVPAAGCPAGRGPRAVPPATPASVVPTVSCRDTARPVVTALRVAGRSLRGRARDGGCAGLRRVEVSVRRAVGSRCRFLTGAGRLSAPRACSQPLTRAVRGRASFARTLPRGLPAGRYVVVARAVDRSGNRSRAVRRVIRVG